MLHLILGTAGTGKTHHMLQQLKQRAQNGQRCLFLVPEQFSSSAESLVYQTLGDALSALVEVVSFRTLAGRILRQCGGDGLPLLGPAGRVVFLRRALEQHAVPLAALTGYRRSAAFYGLCADAVQELKTAGATPGQLRAIAEDSGQQKFAELAEIMAAYQQAIEGAAADPEDRLALAARNAGCGYLENKHCFIDNFDGFTAPEYTMLRQLIGRCASVQVALCCDALAETDEGLGLFSPVRRTAARLQDIATEEGVPTAAPLVLATPRRSGQSALRAVAALLAGGSAPPNTQSDGLYLTEATDEWQEVALVAAEMRRLALAGVPFSRMAVVCRDLGAYESIVRRQFGLYGIPYYTDATVTVEFTPPVAFLRGALALLAHGLTSDAVLALLKSGLCGCETPSLAALENYVFTWAPKAADWRAPFKNNPDGLQMDISPEAARQLQLAEALRAEVIPKIQQFIATSKKKTAKELSKQLYLFLDEMGGPQNLEQLAENLEQQNESQQAAWARRSWDVAMELLDQMAALFPGEVLPTDEYDELFLMLVRATEVGLLPQTLECAVFTEAGRMRLADPDYCFVLGLCEGEFPRQVGYSGLLTHTDRDLLVAGGIQLPGSFENRMLLEEMFFYRALTAPRSGLYLSWPAHKAGAASSASAALQPIRDALSPPPLSPSFADLAATPEAAFALLSESYRLNNAEAATLQAALAGVPDTPLPLLTAVQNEGNFQIQDKHALGQLAGAHLTLSATRAEQYYECRYRYFFQRMLRVQPRRKADFSPLESGQLVHHVLEQTLREAGAAFADCTDAELAAMAGRHTDNYVASLLPAPTRRQQHLLARVRRAVSALLARMRDAAAQSDFAIDAVELPIGAETGAVPPLQVTTPAGRTVQLTGKIDRVDTMHKNGKTYLCVVDYKTGGKEFNLADVYCGLNMQMLIYMQSLCENANDRYPNPVPAGVLYLSADPAPVSRADAKDPTEAIYKVDGLLLDDPDVLRGLDKEGQGVFLPFAHRDGKASRAGKKLADLAAMGAMERHVQKLLAQMADGIFGGNYEARPAVSGERTPCDYCPYRPACRHESGKGERKVALPPEGFAEPNGGGGPHG